MPGYIAAIDQGTTSTRCMVFDGAAEVISAHQEEHEQIFPRPGWVEHSPAEIRERMNGNLCRCGAYANIVPAIADAASR